MNLLTLFLSALLINNVILSKFIGMCPFLGVSTKLSSAVGMGLAVIFVVFGASVLSWALYYYALVPLGLEYMKLICFILLIASFVQFVEMFLKKAIPSLYEALGVYLPLITTNCAVLGVAINNVNNNYDIFTGVVNGFATSVGFAIAIIILAGIREKMEYNDIPRPFKGMPMVLLTAGLMAIAFCGFSGLL